MAIAACEPVPVSVPTRAPVAALSPPPMAMEYCDAEGDAPSTCPNAPSAVLKSLLALLRTPNADDARPFALFT